MTMTTYAPEKRKVMTVPLVALKLLGAYWKTPPAAVGAEPTWTTLLHGLSSVYSTQ